MKEKIYTLGVDVGASYIKVVLMDADPQQLIDKVAEKIRRRDPEQVAQELMDYLLERNNLHYEDMAYIASTGEGEMVPRKTGHFYSITTHARGGKFFFPNAKIVMDMGGMYVKAIKVDEKGKALDYTMTGQCASGSGQFIENISRYLGLAIEEVGDISLKADEPELPSGICAVLAETDVINSVSRGIRTPNIVKGIHLSIAKRTIRLLAKLKGESPIALGGGMAMNKGMIQAVEELLADTKFDYELKAHPDAIYSGAIGAALWGGFRYKVLKKKEAAIFE